MNSDGAHRGQAGFDTFTHRRSTIDVPGWYALVHCYGT